MKIIAHSILLCLSVLPIFSAAHLTAAPLKIPYPKALADAAVRVNDLQNLLDGSLIIGNGDLNALVYQEKEGLVMSLTKNDVWDARIDTRLDPPLPTIDLIRKLGALDTAFPLEDNNRGFVLPEGMTWQGPDSYSAAANPCELCGRAGINRLPEPLRVNSIFVRPRRAYGHKRANAPGRKSAAWLSRTFFSLKPKLFLSFRPSSPPDCLRQRPGFSTVSTGCGSPFQETLIGRVCSSP
ncbi:MAG: hypothetical protein BWY83_01841 [bacterium ADurb.Bin478]|nr:MAG: hypothetical protein BWY83_01841 [bacterium ADurb.Bin478]